MPQSKEERAAKARERMRLKRAAERAEREAAAVAAANATNSAAPRTMRDEVDAALAAMKWLVESDRASRAQAKMLAEDVDVLRHAGETTKALSAQRALSRVLADLGGTPTVRMQHELRSLKAQKVEGSDGSEGEGAATGGNVSAFKRPEKRTR